MLFFNKWLTLPESESPLCALLTNGSLCRNRNRPLCAFLTNGSLCRNRNRPLRALLTNGSLYAGMTGRKTSSIANKKQYFVS